MSMVMCWMDGVAAGCQYVGQQDGAHAHNAMAAQDWCLLSHETSVYLAAQTVAHYTAAFAAFFAEGCRQSLPQH
jgi:hypothetical protein